MQPFLSFYSIGSIAPDMDKFLSDPFFDPKALQLAIGAKNTSVKLPAHVYINQESDYFDDYYSELTNKWLNEPIKSEAECNNRLKSFIEMMLIGNRGMDTDYIISVLTHYLINNNNISTDADYSSVQPTFEEELVVQAENLAGTKNPILLICFSLAIDGKKEYFAACLHTPDEYQNGTGASYHRRVFEILLYVLSKCGMPNISNRFINSLPMYNILTLYNSVCSFDEEPSKTLQVYSHLLDMPVPDHSIYRRCKQLYPNLSIIDYQIWIDEINLSVVDYDVYGIEEAFTVDGDYTDVLDQFNFDEIISKVESSVIVNPNDEYAEDKNSAKLMCVYDKDNATMQEMLLDSVGFYVNKAQFDKIMALRGEDKQSFATYIHNKLADSLLDLWGIDLSPNTLDASTIAKYKECASKNNVIVTSFLTVKPSRISLMGLLIYLPVLLTFMGNDYFDEIDYEPQDLLDVLDGLIRNVRPPLLH
jgi:hypothetical protein